MGVEREYWKIIGCFIFIPQAYYLKYLKAKPKILWHTEAESRFLLLNNFNNKLSEGMLWSMGTILRKGKNIRLLLATHRQ